MGIRAKIAEAFVSFVADITGLKSGLKDAEKETKATAGKISSAIGKVGAIVFPAGVAASIIATGKAAIDTADALDNMSIRTGVSVETLSVLDWAAKMSDTSLQTVAGSFRALANAQDQGRSGAQTAIASFRAIGVSLRDLQTLNPEQLWMKTVEGLAKIEDPALRAAKAQEVFGKSGTEMLTLVDSLANGGFEKFAKEAAKLGLVIDTQTARAAAEFNDNVDRLTSSLQGGANSIVREWLPAVNALTATHIDAATSTTSWANPLKLVGNTIKYFVIPIVVTAQEIIATFVTSATDSLMSLGRALELALSGEFKKAWEEVGKSGQRQLDLFGGVNERIIASLEKLAPLATAVEPAVTKVTTATTRLTDAQIQANAAAREAILQMELELAKLRGNTAEVERLTAEQDKLAAAKMRAAGISEDLIRKTIALNRETRIAAEVMKNGAEITPAYAAALEKLNATKLAEANAIRIADQARAAEFVAMTTRMNAIPALIASVEDRYFESMTTMGDMAVETSNTMTYALGDTMYAALTGDLDDIDDIFKDFFKSLLRQIVNFMAQQAVMKLLTSFGGAGTLPITGSSVASFGPTLGVAGAAGGGIFAGGISPIAAFARGGMVQDPTLALVGEGRFDEAVIPMPNGAVPVEMFAPDRETNVNLNQRIVLDAGVLQAMKSSPDEMITVVSSDILRGGSIFNAIQSRTRK